MAAVPKIEVAGWLAEVVEAAPNEGAELPKMLVLAALPGACLFALGSSSPSAPLFLLCALPNSGAAAAGVLLFAPKLEKMLAAESSFGAAESAG